MWRNAHQHDHFTRPGEVRACGDSVGDNCDPAFDRPFARMWPSAPKGDDALLAFGSRIEAVDDHGVDAKRLEILWECVSGLPQM